MPTHTYSECIEQNVIDSKGTLILSCGKPTGNLDFAREMTLKHRHQLLGIDLDLTNFIEASSLVHDWIQLRRIDALYVTGSGAAFVIIEKLWERLKETHKLKIVK